MYKVRNEMQNLTSVSKQP